MTSPGAHGAMPINVLITVKSVPDPNSVTSALAEQLLGTGGRTPTGLHYVVNEYDLHAIEAGLRLCEQTGGEATAVNVGGDTGPDALRLAMAMGVHRAVHVPLEPTDPLAATHTARILAAVARRLSPVDVILGGRQASDTDGGEMIYRVAAQLGIDAVGPVVELSCDGPSSLVCTYLADGGVGRVRVPCPVALSISSEANDPRVPPIAARIRAGRAEITTLTTDELEIAPGGPDWHVARIVRQGWSSRVELVGRGLDGREAGRVLADRLSAEGLVR